LTLHALGTALLLRNTTPKSLILACCSPCAKLMGALFGFMVSDCWLIWPQGAHEFPRIGLPLELVSVAFLFAFALGGLDADLLVVLLESCKVLASF